MANDRQLTTNDRRPVLATVAGVAHVLMGLCCVAVSVYALVLTRSPKILQDKDAADAVYGLKIGAAVVAPVALLYLIGGIGLWKGRIWGWVLGLVIDVLTTAALLSDSISERRIDWDDMSVAAIFPVLLVVMFLPRVRRWCWRRKRLTRQSAADVPV